jgi:hypothetical protein
VKKGVGGMQARIIQREVSLGLFKQHGSPTPCCVKRLGGEGRLSECEMSTLKKQDKTRQPIHELGRGEATPMSHTLGGGGKKRQEWTPGGKSYQ